MSQSDEEEEEENYVYSDDEELEEEEDEEDYLRSTKRKHISECGSSQRDRADSNVSNSGRTHRLGDSEYVLIERSDVAKTMAAKAREVSELLDVSLSCAEALLRGADWSSERLLESYWSDGSTLAKTVGVDTWSGGANTEVASDVLCGLDSVVPLPSFPRVVSKNAMKECRICFGDIGPNNAVAAPCGHFFCLDCYTAYLIQKVEDEGHTCVTTQCPEDGCTTLVPPNLWNAVLGGTLALPPAVVSSSARKTRRSARAAKEQSSEAMDIDPPLSTAEKKIETTTTSDSIQRLEKYRKYRIDHFINLSKELRWCPAAMCNKVIRAGPCVTSVKCAPNGCNCAFCMKCGDEAHQPASCALMRRWQEKCQNESETANWILANTKRCPKCQTRIEKNQGCNHMSCSQCKHEFCWMCMGDWNEHGASTGGYYKCNKFDPMKSAEGDDSDTARAKRELDRYLHFYKRYHGHDQAQKFAIKQLAATEKRMIELQESTQGSWIDVQFLKTANEMVVDCRRTLKSTYIFGYYLDPKAKKQRELFENLQEHLERFTETLSELTEQTLDKMDRTEVVNITRVTESFLHNLIAGAENGLELAVGPSIQSSASTATSTANDKEPTK